jgi:hypothetical protein
MMNAGPHLDLSHQTHHVPPTRRLLIALGGALLLVALVVGADQLWQHAFGFSAAESWALAVGLWAYIALVVLIMTIVGFAVMHDR